jgi:zinc transport system substrate-binding protein
VATRTSLAARAVVATLLAAAVIVPGCSPPEDPWKNVPGGQPRVLVSFAPLYCFAKAVGGPDVAVLSLMTGTGPHDHRPTPDDMIAANKADLFLLNGLALDDSMIKVANGSGNSRKDLVQKLGEAIPESQRIPVSGAPHSHGPGVKCDCCNGEFDPHVWLGIDEAVLMVNRIAELLEAREKDPARKPGYRERADAYVKKLRELHAYGKAAFKGKKNLKFVTNHHSFRYFARSFGLEVVDSIQMQPGVDPDGAQLARLVEICKREQVRVIGVEPQYSRGAAETLQRNLNQALPDLAVIELDPIETAPPDQLSPDYYLKRMQANIDNLAKHLR